MDYKHTSEERFVSTMPPDGQDFVRDALEKDFDFDKDHFIAFEPRDSKLMDEAYRRGLLNTIRSRPEEMVLVTHGTDTLLQTAEFFYRELDGASGLSAKTILLTGAMIPLAVGPESDGYLNLKFSLEQLSRFDSTPVGKEREAIAGIYIVLCDYESPETEAGAWQPRLYRYYPNHYQKIYATDGRYNRLRKI